MIEQIDTPSITTTQEEDWINVQVDSQTLGLFMACPQKYEYKIIKALVPKGGVSRSIERGTIVHNASLAYWKYRIEKGDLDVEPAVRNALQSAKEELLKSDKFSTEQRIEVLNGLLEYLRYIQGENWIPVEAEKFFRVLAFEDPIRKLRIYLTGRIDLIVKNAQTPRLPIDLKTESVKWFYSQMSNQFKIYCIATGTNVIGIQRVGFQESKEPKEKFKMELIGFDADVLEEFRTVTLPHWVEQMILAHHSNFFPMNTTNCIHGHFKCEFSDGNDHRGICNVSRNVRDQKLVRFFQVGEVWNPEKGSYSGSEDA